MSDYSIAFISNEAVTRSYANEFLTEKWLGISKWHHQLIVKGWKISK